MESKSRNPDRYKTKSCPTCNTTHKKRGLFCSRSCGNRRTYSQKQRQAKSVERSAYLNSPEAVEQRNISTENIQLANKKAANKDDADLQAMTLDDVYVPPLTLSTDHNQFVASGDLWTEVD